MSKSDCGILSILGSGFTRSSYNKSTLKPLLSYHLTGDFDEFAKLAKKIIQSSIDKAT